MTHAPYRVWAFFAEGGRGITNEPRFEGGDETNVGSQLDTFVVKPHIRRADRTVDMHVHVVEKSLYKW